MKIPANRLSGHLARELRPCYLVSGDEPLLVEEALDAIRLSARERGYDSREPHVQGAGFDWTLVAHAAMEQSLFASRRIVELRLPSGKPGRDGGAAIAALAAQAGDDLLFLVTTPRLDRKAAATNWVKALESAGAHVQVWPVAARELPQWLRERMQSAGLQPDREAVNVIAERVEGNLLAADQEIQKLALLHGRGAVSGADARAAVADSSRFDVFQLVDTALAGHTTKALRMLDGLRAEGAEPNFIIWALGRELRQLARLAEAVRSGEELGAALRRLRVWERKQNLMRSAMSRHRHDQLMDMVEACRIVVAAARGQSGNDPWQLLTNLVWQLAGQARAA